MKGDLQYLKAEKEAEHRSPWQQGEKEILIQSEVDFRCLGFVFKGPWVRRENFNVIVVP